MKNILKNNHNYTIKQAIKLMEALHCLNAKLQETRKKIEKDWDFNFH
jgi:hypothetical protein